LVMVLVLPARSIISNNMTTVDWSCRYAIAVLVTFFTTAAAKGGVR
jgi:hypothetical protein